MRQNTEQRRGLPCHGGMLSSVASGGTAWKTLPVSPSLPFPSLPNILHSYPRADYEIVQRSHKPFLFIKLKEVLRKQEENRIQMLSISRAGDIPDGGSKM